jgi:RNA polymerase sigma-70 factor, ECF subfamily
MKGVGDDRYSLEPPRASRAQFEREVAAHLDGLYTFALTLVGRGEDAEHLVADTIARALDGWQRYTLDTNVRAWLFTILYHLSDRREEGVTEEDDETLSLDRDLERDFYDAIADDEIARAIDALPAHSRDAVVLRDVHKFRYFEIASILGVPESVARSRLFRGRRLLRGDLLRHARAA